MNKRWYDEDPNVSFAVSLIKDANELIQSYCADMIIDYAKSRDVELKSNTLNDAFNYIFKRWYEKNEKISQAFEYFELAPREIRQEIAFEVIHLLQHSNMR